MKWISSYVCMAQSNETMGASQMFVWPSQSQIRERARVKYKHLVGYINTCPPPGDNDNVAIFIGDNRRRGGVQGLGLGLTPVPFKGPGLGPLL